MKNYSQELANLQRNKSMEIESFLDSKGYRVGDPIPLKKAIEVAIEFKKFFLIPVHEFIVGMFEENHISLHHENMPKKMSDSFNYETEIGFLKVIRLITLFSKEFDEFGGKHIGYDYLGEELMVWWEQSINRGSTELVYNTIAALDVLSVEDNMN